MLKLESKIHQSARVGLAALLAASLCVPATFAFANEPESIVGEISAADEDNDEATDDESIENSPLLDLLSAEYEAAKDVYEQTLKRQAENTERITQLKDEITTAETQYREAQERLETASIEMYKNAAEPGDLIDSMLRASSLRESITLYDDYAHIQAARQGECEEARAACKDLRTTLTDLNEERAALDAEVEQTREKLEAAKDALRKASHLDGAKYHQVQKNGVNCGATAFTVGVNIMLGKKKFKDNEKVWASEAFGCDSTVNLAEKGQAFLEDNDLDDQLSFDYVKGDITQTDKLRKLLEAGNVVVISSGSGSEWVRVDKAEPQKGLYPDGHWIVFYGYEKGIYYANDSAVTAKKGAGCPYTEDQMQQWLDGRATHFACVLSRVESSEDSEIE